MSLRLTITRRYRDYWFDWALVIPPTQKVIRSGQHPGGLR